MVRRLVMSGGLDHMLTLTYRDNRTDALQCDRDLTRFLRLWRAEHDGELVYVAVMERQKRGACHWHLAVAGWQQVRLIRSLWLRVAGDGNIDVRAWHGRGQSDNPTKLACYLSKYVSKSINDRVAGVHRYRRSHNIVVQEIVEEHDDADLGLVTASIFRRVLGRGPAFILRADVGAVSFMWACSWGSDGDRSELASGGIVEPPSG